MTLDIIKRLKNNKTLMNGTLFSMYSFFNRGVSFILLLILARYILPADYGRLSLFNTIVQFLGYFIALSTQGYFSVSYFQRKGDLFRQDFTSIVLIMTVCTLIISFFLIFSQNFLARFADLPPLFLWFALLICVAQIFFGCYLDLLRVEEKVTKYGIISCGFAILSFALTIYLVIDKGLNWHGRVYSHLICTILFGLAGLIILFHKKLFSRRVTWKGTKMILLWGIPLIPHEATSWIKQGCDQFIIKGTHSIEDVGVFSFALTLTSVIIMIGSAFNATNSVSIYQILSSDNTPSDKLNSLKSQTRNIGIIYIAGYILVLVFGSLLVPIALPKYSACLPYFWITSISGFLYCLYYLFVNYLFYYHKNHIIMVITVLTAFLHLGLSLLLTKYSLFLTAIIYVFSQALMLVLIVLKAQKTIRANIVNNID